MEGTDTGHAAGWSLPVRVLAVLFGAALTGSRLRAREFGVQLSEDFRGAGTTKDQSDALMLYSLFYGLISALLLLAAIGCAALADYRHHRHLADGITDFVGIPQLVIWWVPIMQFQVSRIRLRRSGTVVKPPGAPLLVAILILATATAISLHLSR